MTTLKEARSKINIITVTPKVGETYSALQPDDKTFHSVTIKRAGPKGYTVYNHVTKKEEWYTPSDLHNARGPVTNQRPSPSTKTR